MRECVASGLSFLPLISLTLMFLSFGDENVASFEALTTQYILSNFIPSMITSCLGKIIGDHQ
jgi:hypothetical protein